MGTLLRFGRWYWRLNQRAWPSVKEAAPWLLLLMAAVLLAISPR